MNSSSLPRDAPECGSKCRSRLDAVRLRAVLSKCSDEREALVYLVLGGVCAQPGKVADGMGRTLLHLAAAKGYR